MRYRFALLLGITLILTCIGVSALAQNPENWTSDQLMQPADLATTLKSGKDLPVIFAVGPGNYIPNGIVIGMTKEKENLDKLKKELKKLSSTQKIVIYCGCCPFAHCPNVRPAIDLLKKERFTNYFLLNIPKNIKTDWIDKGYPVNP